MTQATDVRPLRLGDEAPEYDRPYLAPKKRPALAPGDSRSVPARAVDIAAVEAGVVQQAGLN